MQNAPSATFYNKAFSPNNHFQLPVDGILSSII